MYFVSHSDMESLVYCSLGDPYCACLKKQNKKKKLQGASTWYRKCTMMVAALSHVVCASSGGAIVAVDSWVIVQ